MVTLNDEILADIASATEFDTNLTDAKNGEIETYIVERVRVKKYNDSFYVEFEKPLFVCVNTACDILAEQEIDLSELTYVELEDQGSFRRHIFHKI